MRLTSLASLTILLMASVARGDRLSSRSLDLGKIERVHLAPGLISVLDFPEAITEVSTGAPQVFRAIVSAVHPTELLIQIVSQRPFASNLIVRTVKRTFVFDLVPSLTKHQDVLKVRGGYGSLKDSSESKVLEKGVIR